MIPQLEKKIYAIGRTQEGKHVILQQAARSCVPSSVAMLVLDHGKIPDYDAVHSTNVANNEQAEQWIKDAGLRPYFSKPSSLEALVQCLQERGPGCLSITHSHPDVGSHYIVLDAISLEDRTAEIREPLHGWALTIKLDPLLQWAGPTFVFLQIDHA